MGDMVRVLMRQSVVIMPSYVRYEDGQTITVDAVTAAQWIKSGVAVAAPDLAAQPGSYETTAIDPASERAVAIPEAVKRSKK